MTDEERKQRAYEAGERILVRAIEAKDRGEIADFFVFVNEDDIITHIQLVRSNSDA